ncbi:MAG: hypothetical protein ACLQQ4_04660 [Bacteroidia bacterium]
MKNTNSKYTDAILEFIKSNAGATIDGIKEGCPKVSDIMVRKVLKDLQAENLLTVGDDGGYTFISKKNGATVESKVESKKIDKKEVVKSEPKAGKTTEKKKEEELLGPATVHSRDNSKYDFDGQKALSKGRLVLAVVRKYVEDNPKASLAKVQEVFDSKNIQKRYGVLEEVSKAKKHTKNNRDRYFLKPEDIIKVGNQKAAVTNQWGADSLKPFLAITKTLGYKVSITK